MQTNNTTVDQFEIPLGQLRPRCVSIVEASSISEVARTLGVSRTAVRDALKDWGPEKPFQYIDLRIRILQIEKDVTLADVHLIFEPKHV